MRVLQVPWFLQNLSSLLHFVQNICKVLELRIVLKGQRNPLIWGIIKTGFLFQQLSEVFCSGLSFKCPVSTSLLSGLQPTRREDKQDLGVPPACCPSTEPWSLTPTPFPRLEPQQFGTHRLGAISRERTTQARAPRLTAMAP